MITKKAIEFEISSLTTIKGVAEAYEEIAAIRIRRNRDNVLRSRQFSKEINDLFQQVKVSSANLIDPKKRSFLAKNGKTLFVFLSTNTGLHGDIVRRTFNLFSKYVGEYADNVLIVGRSGLQLTQEHEIIKPLTYLDFPENAIDSSFINRVSSYLLQFERVIVFYAKFEGIMHQEESMIDISGNPPPASGPVGNKLRLSIFLNQRFKKFLLFLRKKFLHLFLNRPFGSLSLPNFLLVWSD